MLCVILTNQKVFASATGKAEKRLTFGASPYLEASKGPGKLSMEKALASQLDTLAKGYYKATQTTEADGPIPTSVGYAISHQPGEGHLSSLEAIKNFFAQARARAFDLVHVEPLHLSLLREAGGAETKAIVLEALDDYVNLLYCNVPAGKVNCRTHETDSVKFFTYKNLGRQHAAKALVDELSTKFDKAGLKVGQKDRGELQRQVSGKKNSGEGKFSLTRQSEGVKIQAELTLSRDQFEKATAANIEELKQEMARDKVDALGISEVLLVGDYFENRVVQNYLTKDLKLGKMVRPFPSLEMEKIARGLHARAAEIMKQREEVLRKQKEDEARKKALEAAKVLQINRENLMAEIASRCNNPAQKDKYQKEFEAKGASLNIPAEVISWNIDEALKRVELQIPAPVPVQVAPATKTVQSKKVIAPQEKPKKPETFKKQFSIEGVLHDPEFESRKVIPYNDSKPRTLRLLSAEHFGDPIKVENFMKLYQKELAYYQELSEIHESVEGKFYHRTFIPRETLSDYVKRIGLDNKISFDKLTSKDLKFITGILEEVKRLPVSHADLSENNILVIREKKWRGTYQVRFVGFTSKECTSKQMEDRVHEIFERLLRPKVYAELRKTLNI